MNPSKVYSSFLPLPDEMSPLLRLPRLWGKMPSMSALVYSRVSSALGMHSSRRIPASLTTTALTGKCGKKSVTFSQKQVKKRALILADKSS